MASVNRRRTRFAALQLHSTCGVERLHRRACKILREMSVSRDALDHILDAVKAGDLVRHGGEMAKVRTTSQ
jgi:hypothetical protein